MTKLDTHLENIGDATQEIDDFIEQIDDFMDDNDDDTKVLEFAIEKIALIEQQTKYIYDILNETEYLEVGEKIENYSEVPLNDVLDDIELSPSKLYEISSKLTPNAKDVIKELFKLIS